MNDNLMLASSVTLLLFLALSVFDGIYFHLWKFRLQERDDSKFEHVTHTIRSVLFIPMIVLIYWFGLKGLLLWATIGILAIDLVTEVLDVINERESRMSLGGLPSTEYLVHITLTTLRVAAITLAFAALPSEAWNLHSEVEIAMPYLAKFIALQTLPGAIFVAGLHIYLIFDPTLVSRVESLVKSKCCPNQINHG